MRIIKNIHTFFLRSFSVVFTSLFFYVGAQAHFEIVELMPNTTDDTNLEYIILKNNSVNSENLKDYYIQDLSGKIYTFGEEILGSGERKQFFRTQTKIILNNTNEEVFLYRENRELEDSVSYVTSVKGEFLNFEDINIDDSEEIISDEYISGEAIFISDEVHISLPEEPPIVLQVPEVYFSLQRPSYISQSGSTDIYICDSEHDECKVNFDLRESFSSELPEKDYICEIDFGLGEITGEEQKCNPNTVTFPEGEYDILFKIFHEDDLNIFSEKQIHIIHSNRVIHTFSIGGGGANEVPKPFQILISYPNILIQSGVTGGGSYFYCEKTKCKVNFEYKKQFTQEQCLWKFGDGIASSASTHTRCNPGYVSYGPGIHRLSLKIYEKDNPDNQKTLTFFVYNEILETPLVAEIEEGIIQEKNRDNTELKIELQGTLGKEKSLLGSVLECHGVEKCYVNFEGIFEGNEDDFTYIWKQDGIIFSEEKNPKGIWLEGIGEHKVEFIIINGGVEVSRDFFVVVIQNNVALLSSEGEEIQRGGFVVEQATIAQTKKNIAKIFTQSFLVLKYDGLRISGKAPIGSKVEIYHKGEKIFEGRGDEKGKYRFVSKKFGVGKHIFDTKLILELSEEIFIEHSGLKEVTAADRAFWFLPVKTKKTSKKVASKNIKLPQLIIQTQANENVEEKPKNEISLEIKIFLGIIISLTLVFGFLHLLLRELSHFTPKFSIDSYREQFSVKLKVSMII